MKCDIHGIVYYIAQYRVGFWWVSVTFYKEGDLLSDFPIKEFDDYVECKEALIEHITMPKITKQSKPAYIMRDWTLEEILNDYVK